MTDLPDYSKRRFLIVDDENFMLGLVERMLKQCNAGHIFKAEDAGTAFKMIRDEMTQVDCIISDCNMPVINGLQFLKAIRLGRNPKIPRTQPFILLTGYGDVDLVKTAIALDVSGYVVKPVPFDKLIAKINHALSAHMSLRDTAYYEGIEVPKVVDRNFNADVPKQKTVSGWVVLRQERSRTNASIQKSLAAIREEVGAISVVDEVKLKNRRPCKLSELQTGMILTDDIHAEEGIVLVKRGTPVSEKIIERLRDIAAETGGDERVWIGDLAT